MLQAMAPQKIFRKRRSIAALFVGLSLFVLVFYLQQDVQPATVSAPTSNVTTDVLSATDATTPLARELLDTIEVKGRAAKTGYKRSQYGAGWASVGGCDMRNIMLGRYLRDKTTDDANCIVFSGVLDDSYTGKTINFVRGQETSDDVQIDHVVALSDSWQKGAQSLSPEVREQFANDPLNLIPVDGDTNQKKGDSDAASWLPPNKGFRCQYVARQIAVKSKYSLWVTDAEKAAMSRVLSGCGDQRVPVETTR